MSKSFEELISKANQKTLKKVSVSNAQDEPVLQAVKAKKSKISQQPSLSVMKPRSARLPLLLIWI